MDKKETKIIRLSVLVLSLALVFIYVFWFNVKGEFIADILNNLGNNNPEILITNEDALNQSKPSVETNLQEDNSQSSTWTEMDTKEPETEKNDSSPVVISMGNNENQDPKNNDTISIDIASNQWNQDSLDSFVPNNVNSRIILDGTDIYNWEFDFDDKLALEYEYALKDARWIHYLFLWDSIDPIALWIKANQLSWDLFEMNTEMEIINNQLFGEKIIFINLPEYKDQFVLMIVRVDWNYWLVYLELPTYIQSKSYLKKLFTS